MTMFDREYNVPPLKNKEDLPTHKDLITPFRSRSNSSITVALFKEISNHQADYAIYTLDDRDFSSEGRTYYSIKKKFLEEGDITGYALAEKWLDGWSHFQKLLKTPRFRRHFEAWCEELEVKLRSEGLKQVIKLAGSGSYNASKLLLDKGWAQKRGRPSNEEVKGELRKEARIKEDIEEDLHRIGLSIVRSIQK